VASKYKRVHPSKWMGVYQYGLKDKYRGKQNVCYYICYRLDGKLKWEKVGKASEHYTPAVAAEIRSKRVKDARHGQDVKTARDLRADKARQNRPFGEIADIYFENKGRDLKGLTTDLNRYQNHLEPRFAKVLVSDIMPLDIEDLKTAMANHKPATLWNTLELFRRIINYGKKNELTQGLKFTIEMPKKDNEIVEYLSPEESKRLLDTLQSWPSRDVANMLLLAYFTGMRRGEIFKLRDDDVDMNMRLIRIRSPKGGKTSAIGLSRVAAEIIRQQLEWRDDHHPGSHFIFPGKNGDQRTDCSAVRRIRVHANLPTSFRPFHGLRHHFAVSLANSGQFTLDMIAEMLTHKSVAMTKRYGQFLPESLTKASDVASDLLVNGLRKRDDSYGKLF